MKIAARSFLALLIVMTASAVCAATTSAITEFQLPPGSAPFAITTGPDNALWFTEAGTDKIGRLTTSLVFSEYALTAGSRPYGICKGPDGALWFTQAGTDRIARITTSGDISEFPLTAGANPHGITAGPDGNVWFVEYGGNKIGQITPSGQVTEFNPLSPNSGLEDITLGPDGNLWYTETNNPQIGRITPSGIITEFPTDVFTSLSITSAPDGNLYFTPGSTQQLVDSLGQMTTAGIYTFVFDNRGDTPYMPRRITVGPDGNLWFTQRNGDEFARLALSQQSWIYLYETLDFPLTPGSGAQGITGGPDGQLWFAENSVDKIGAMAPPDFSLDQPTYVCNPQSCPPFVEGLPNTSLVAAIRTAQHSSASDFAVTINWGDESAPSQGTVAGGPTTFTVAGTHTFPDYGPYNVTMTVTRDNFVTAVLYGGVTVLDAPIVAASVGPLTATVGVPLSGQFGSFTDGDPNPNLADLTAGLYFGDENCRPPCYTIGTITKAPNGSYLVSSSHTYLAPGTYNYTVAIFDKGTGLGYPYTPASSASSTVTVQSAPNFSLSSSGGGGVNPGQTAGPYTVAVNTTNFVGTVSFDCTGLPMGAACLFNPTSINLNGANASSQLMITTMGSSMAGDFGRRPPGRLPLQLALWFPFVGIVSTCCKRKKRSAPNVISKGMMLLALIASLALISCGGNGNNSLNPANRNQTPAGSYQVLVTGSSGSVHQTTTLTLTVN